MSQLPLHLENLNRRACLLATLLFFMIASSLSAFEPIRLMPGNPRYFEWRGRPLVLVASGEHYGSVVNPDFNYIKYLDAIQAVGLNHTRLFLGEYVEEPDSFGIVDNPLAPAPGRFLAPWARSSTPGYRLGGNKFDLNQWDPAYFLRLHDFLGQAEKRGIVVEAVLFFSGPTILNHPLYSENNVNQLDQVDGKAYLSLKNGNVLERQEAYARKLVRELNPHGNVILNLCNEPWFFNQERDGFVSQASDPVKAWIQRVAEWVRSEESRLPSRHLLSVDLMNQGERVSAPNLEGPYKDVSVFNVHYDGNADILRLNPDLGRALAFNETGFNGTEDELYRTQGWRFLLSGGALYGNLDFGFVVGREDGTASPKFSSMTYNAGGSPALRRQLKVLLDFMLSLPLERCRPDNSIVVGGVDSWCALASPGEAYAIWFPGNGPFESLINIPAGEWIYEWVNPLSGFVTRERASHSSWVAAVRGERVGGGVGLRIVRADGATTSSGRVAQEGSAVKERHPGAASAPSEAEVGRLAELGVEMMKNVALKRGSGGVAVMAFMRGDHPISWISRMAVANRFKDVASDKGPGANLVAIAYAKLCEMADSLKNSGHAERPKMLGETAWEGGVIQKVEGGFWLAAFSGSSSEEDVELSNIGIGVVLGTEGSSPQHD